MNKMTETQFKIIKQMSIAMQNLGADFWIRVWLILLTGLDC